MKAASNESFGYNDELIVSSDIIGMRFGSLFDATQTMVSKIDDDTYQDVYKRQPSRSCFTSSGLLPCT